jgi:hypothetical protein
MVHDGDQNKTGGDAGQDCVYFTMAGAAPTATPTPTPTPSATPTAAPGTVVAGGNTFSGKTVTVKFQNNTAVGQLLTCLSITWPQVTNGSLNKIIMNNGATNTTIYNMVNNTGSLSTCTLLGTTAQRTIPAGSCGTLTFNFANTASTNSALYTGTATFSPFGPVPYFP